MPSRTSVTYGRMKGPTASPSETEAGHMTETQINHLLGYIARGMNDDTLMLNIIATMAKKPPNVISETQNLLVEEMERRLEKGVFAPWRGEK